MSEEEKFNALIQAIKEIYLSLTQGEPSPDEEIEARANLIENVQNLIMLDAPQVSINIQLFEETLTKLETSSKHKDTRFSFVLRLGDANASRSSTYVLLVGITVPIKTVSLFYKSLLIKA